MDEDSPMDDEKSAKQAGGTEAIATKHKSRWIDNRGSGIDYERHAVNGLTCRMGKW